MFAFGCFFMGAYMTVTQSMGFLENRDSSTISYNHFNQEPIDRYPTFSVCLRGKDLYWKDEESLFSSVGLTGAQYTRTLQGNGFRMEVDEITQLNTMRMVDFANVSMINFDEHSLSASSILIRADLMTDDESQTLHFDTSSASQEKLPFHVGFRSADQVCFTRNSLDEAGLIRRYDLISLNRSLLSPGVHFNLEMIAFVHYPGQILRNFENPRFMSTLSSFDTNKILELKLSHVTTLRKRPSANIRCDDRIENDDLNYQKQVVKMIGCIPIYWKDLMRDQADIKVCQSSKKLRDAAFLIKNYKDILASYDPPCVEMSTLVIVNNNMPQEYDEFQIIVRYTEDVYQKIENSRDISFETYFSGVGGFVGIFCGYSILQFPELMENVLPYITRDNIAAILGKPDFNFQI